MSIPVLSSIVNHLYTKSHTAITTKEADLNWRNLRICIQKLSTVLANNRVSNTDNIIVFVKDVDKMAIALCASGFFAGKIILVDPALDESYIDEISKSENARIVISQLGMMNSAFENTNACILMESICSVKESVHKSPDTPFNLSIYFKQDTEIRNLILSCEYLIDIIKETNNSISPKPSDSILLYGKLPFEQVIIDLLWSLSQGLHLLVFPDEKIPIEELFSNKEIFPFDFSFFYFGNYESSSGANKYELLLDTVKHADRQKYKAVWTPERHFNAFGGLFPNPSVLSAALSVITENVQIRCGSLVSPLHHTLRIAEDWSVIDNLSNGRAAISFASGWQCNDFAFYPERYHSRNNIMINQINEVKNLWKGIPLIVNDGLNATIKVNTYPRPVQHELPVWVTVSGKLETFVEAGKIGANILTHLLWQDPSELIEKIAAYRKSLDDNDFDPDFHKVSVMVHTYLGSDNETVKETVKKPLKEYIRSSVHLIEAMTQSIKGSKEKNSVGRYGKINDSVDEKLLDELVELAFERFYENSGLLGTKEKCHKVIDKLKSYGVDEIACLLDFGLSHNQISDGLSHLDRIKERYDPARNKKNHITLVKLTQRCFDTLNESIATSFWYNSVRTIILSSPKEIVPSSNFSKLLILHYNFNANAKNSIITYQDNSGVFKRSDPEMTDLKKTDILASKISDNF